MYIIVMWGTSMYTSCLLKYLALEVSQEVRMTFDDAGTRFARQAWLDLCIVHNNKYSTCTDFGIGTSKTPGQAIGFSSRQQACDTQVAFVLLSYLGGNETTCSRDASRSCQRA